MNNTTEYMSKYNKLIKFRQKHIIDNKSNWLIDEHHIIPKCFGGSNDKSNLVKLTINEHIIAHWLLYKHYYLNQDFYKSNKMYCALYRMVGSNNCQQMCNNTKISSNVLSIVSQIRILHRIPQKCREYLCKIQFSNFTNQKLLNQKIIDFFLPAYKEYKKHGIKSAEKILSYGSKGDGNLLSHLIKFIPNFMFNRNMAHSQNNQKLINIMYKYCCQFGYAATIQHYKDIYPLHLTYNALYKMFCRHIKNFSKDSIKTIRNTKWVIVYKGNKSKRIFKSDLQKYLNAGYKCGSNKSSTKNRIGIHKDGRNKFVDKKQLELFINDGWKIGLKSIDCSNIKNISLINVNTQQKIKVSRNELQMYLDTKEWIRNNKRYQTQHV